MPLFHFVDRLNSIIDRLAIPGLSRPRNTPHHPIVVMLDDLLHGSIPEHIVPVDRLDDLMRRRSIVNHAEAKATVLHTLALPPIDGEHVLVLGALARLGVA